MAASISIPSGEYITNLTLSVTPVATGSVLDLSRFPNLTRFVAPNIGATTLGGYGSLPHMINFGVFSNAITGDMRTVLTGIENQTGLQTVNLNNNRMSGAIPNFANNVHLTNFACSFNPLSGSRLPDLTPNTVLRDFEATNCGLTGTIPSFANGTLIRRYACSTNRLTGTLPSLAPVTGLSGFFCAVNSLSGQIPDLSSCPLLVDSHFHINQFTGEIPNLSSNTILRNAQFQSNQLTGSIPDLGSNTTLDIFYCDNNRLTGFNGSVTSGLRTFLAHNNLLAVSAVDNIIAAVVNAGRLTGTLNIGGAGNAALSAAGRTNSGILRTAPRNWTVTAN